MRFHSIILSEIKTILFMILVLIPISIISIPVFLIAFIIRGFINILAKCFRPDLNGLVKGEHAIFAYKTSKKAALNIIMKIVCKGDINLEQFREDFENRIFTVRKNNKQVYDKFYFTWTSFLGYAFWKKDLKFDLKNHIREYDYTGTMEIPHRPDEADVDRILGLLVEAPWNRDRSPWELLKLSNYQLNGERHSIIFIRVDHMLCDGFSLREIIRKVFQTRFEIPQINLGKKPKTLLANLVLLLKLPYDVSKNLLLILGASKFLHSKFATEDIIMSVSPVVDVEMIKKIKNHFKVSFATVIYSAILGGIQTCLDVSGQQVPEKLTSGFVVPLPNHPGGLCIHASVVASEWQLKSSRPEDRLLKIQKNFESISRSTAAVAYINIGRLSAYFPVPIRKAFVEAFLGLGISVGMTSFPASTSPDFYRGHKFVELMGFVGTWSSVGLIIASAGFDNNLRMSCSIERGLFASEDAAQNLGRYIRQELEALLNATG